MTSVPYTTIPQAEPGTPEWYANRMTGIGGSEAAAVCGVSKYRNAMDVYVSKIGLTTSDRETNRAMRKGNALEPFLKSEYELETGYRGYKPEVMFRSVEAPWMIANIDWIGAEGIDRGADFKSTDAPEIWGEAGTEDVPEDYWIQAQVYSFVLKKAVWDVYTLFPRNETRLYPIGADKSAQESIVNQCGEFWREHVEKRIAPAFDPDAQNALSTVKRLYSRIEPVTVTLDQSVGLLVDRYKDLAVKAKSLKYEHDRIQAQLLSFIGEAERGVIPGCPFEVTRSLVEKKGFYTEPTSYTKFSIVKAKG